MGKKVVLVSVGTSALVELHDVYSWDRRRRWNMDKDGYKALVNYLAEERRGDEKKEYYHQKKILLEKLEYRKRKFNNKGEKDYDELSAELASLKAMENAYSKSTHPNAENAKEKAIGDFTDDDNIFLISSNTPEGKLCAEVCKKALEGFINIPLDNCEIIEVDGLQIDDAHKFRSQGITNLRNKIREIKENTDVNAIRYFNITGGFKGMIPLFTMIARENKPMYLVYLFENACNLFYHQVTLLDPETSATPEIILADL